ncbi:MAG: hypothetical protein H6Q69_2985 [Firmicutes bacterium]|nr:hypothetical protein [Bacillota bacterium]
MDIKRSLLDIINSDNNSIYYSYMTIEKLIMVMLKDYISQQNKEFISDYSNNKNFDCDGYAPDGFDEFKGSTAIEIKISRTSEISIITVKKIISYFQMHGGEIQNVILIGLGEISQNSRTRINEIIKNLNFNFFIWDINDLVNIFIKNKTLYYNTYSNLNKIFLKGTISQGIKRNTSTYIDKRKTYIQQLNSEYNRDNIVLFLGAGTSQDAKIATWGTLISELFVALIDKELNKNGIKIDKNDKKKIVKEIIKQNGNSPLLQTRFLRNGFEEEFEMLVSEILYKNALETSNLMEEIGQLCVPNRGKLGIQAVVNYNFDDLVEKNLKRLRVKYHSIYGEGMVAESDEIGIYHVHGFLPENKNGYENLTKSLLVFSEEGYHKLFLEPYNWANITQLNYLINNTCLFIGLSMTDPNLRRLLEIATHKETNGDSNCKHYAIMKKFNITGNKEITGIQKFEVVNELLQESVFKELGINIIWIENYNEIPVILKKIKSGK